VIVRDPADAIGRLIRWNSGTDGESPDGRKHAHGAAGRASPPCPRIFASPEPASELAAPEEDAVFTGIVEELGEVVALERLGDAARLTVRGPRVTAGAATGDSIAVNGVCLTVTAMSGGAFTADVMGETLSRSGLGELGPGAVVNLERSLRLDGRLGGHIVQGHVDGTGTITGRSSAEHWEVVRISMPPGLLRYVVEKGSVAVDGISLTVSAASGGSSQSDGPGQSGEPDQPGWIEVSLIPETLERTTLGRKQAGETVNLEVDMIAKYVERLLGAGARS
jgi:riboflavin synthase